MAITFTKVIIGEYDYTDHKGETYHIQVRTGNCLGVHIWVDTEKDEAHLFNFIANKDHIKNMEKNKADVFENCTNIQFNIADKGAEAQAKYAMRMGHEVLCRYYKAK